MKDERIAGQFVTSVAASEIIISAGIQLLQWASDIAFTDAPFGANWALETADRMASLSELLNIMFKRMPKDALGIVIDLPKNMVGQVSINPAFDPKAEEPKDMSEGSSEREGGDNNTINDFPF